jgi:hypothetical protein
MPEYLPLGAFRQGLLPDDCRSCCWWQTNDATVPRGEAAARIRHEWVTELEHDWGQVGLLVHEAAGRRGGVGSGGIVVSACIHFAPASSLARFRELAFPPLPASSALLFCFHAEEDSRGWAAKRLIRKAIYELRNRGVREVYAIAHWPEGSGDPADCRFFSTEILAANGFEPVSQNGGFCLMRVDNRSVVSLMDQMETALRRVFAHKPAPSPVAWIRGKDGAGQGAA